MKTILVIIIVLVVNYTPSFAQSNFASYMGDCDTMSIDNGPRLLSYPFTAYDSLFKMSIVFPCNNTGTKMEYRKLVQKFRDFEFNNQVYFLSEIEMFTLYHQYNYDLSINEYVFEFRNSNGNTIAVDYASNILNDENNKSDSIQYYNSYFMQLDFRNNYNLTYSETDTNEVSIYYNSSTDYLKKIIDNDRNKLVGLKYYSVANKKEYIYFFEPNN